MCVDREVIKGPVPAAHTDDITPGNELLADNGDGTWTLTVKLSDSPDLLALLDAQHLLFTGDRYTPTKLYLK